MKIVRDILLGAVLIGLTVWLIIILKNTAATGEQTINIANDKLKAFNNYLYESDITLYDGKEVAGSDVIVYIKKHLGEYTSPETAEFYVYVKTSTSTNQYVNGDYIDDIQDFTKDKYIKPSIKFKCEVIRDANDVIVGVNYIQK